jgi:hypothetical protein
METIEILNAVLKHTGMSANGLANAIKLPRSQNLYDIQNGKVKKISPELSEKIVNRFPEINRDFLLTGEGEMLKSITDDSRSINSKSKDFEKEVKGKSSAQHHNSNVMQTICELANSGVILSEANKTIAEANRTIAAANRILSENNKELISLVQSLSSGGVKENQLTVSAVSAPTLQKMAVAGIPHFWKSMDEGLEALGKLLLGGEMVKQE